MKDVAAYSKYRKAIIFIFLLYSISFFAQKTETNDSIAYYEQRINNENDALKKAYLYYNYSNYLDAQVKIKASSEEIFLALKILKLSEMKKWLQNVILLHIKMELVKIMRC